LKGRINVARRVIGSRRRFRPLGDIRRICRVRTDAAFAEARQFCIRNHIASQHDCRSGWLYIRVLPSHAIELSAVYLDRNLERIFAGRPTAKPSAEHKRELASTVHLCGAGAAKSFAHRGFRLVAGERCGDHDAANYLARVREFLRLAASQ